MPRLQILHHKSYHPYNESNKQRVREDEAKAAAAELAIEQARIDQASSARLDELRKRAGSPSFRSPSPIPDENLPSTSSAPLDPASSSSRLLEKHKKDKARQEKREKKLKERLDFDFPSESAKRDEKRRARKEAEVGTKKGVGRVDRDDMWVDDVGQGEDAASVWDSGGHINLFADIEKNEKPLPTPEELEKKRKDKEADFMTMYLGRPEKETKPWYTDRDLKRYEEKATGEEADFRRARDKRKDVRSKVRHDPLTQISTLLASSTKPLPRPRNSQSGSGVPMDPASARISRETSERQRALDMIAKTKAAALAGASRWDDTPSTVAGSRTWAEDFEREKDKAGMRFFGDVRQSSGGRGWDGKARSGRSWEV